MGAEYFTRYLIGEGYFTRHLWGGDIYIIFSLLILLIHKYALNPNPKQLIIYYRSIISFGYSFELLPGIDSKSNLSLHEIIHDKHDWEGTLKLSNILEVFESIVIIHFKGIISFGDNFELLHGIDSKLK